VALLVLAAAALGLSSCGGGGEATATVSKAQAKVEARKAFLKEHPGTARYGSPPLEFETDPSGKLAYTKDEVTASEGNVVLEFTNSQSTPHNVTIERVGRHESDGTKTIKEGFTADHTITLFANEKYRFFCSVPGHRKAGMEGILKVVPG
jgi:plastocyanin